MGPYLLFSLGSLVLTEYDHKYSQVTQTRRLENQVRVSVFSFFAALFVRSPKFSFFMYSLRLRARQ